MELNKVNDDERLDLLPLDIMADICEYMENSEKKLVRRFTPEFMFRMMHNFIKSGDTHFIYYQLQSYICEYHDNNLLEVIVEVSDPEEIFNEVKPCHCYVSDGIRRSLNFCKNPLMFYDHKRYVRDLISILWIVKHRPDLIDLPFTKMKPGEKEVLARTKKKTREEECEAIIRTLENGRRRHVVSGNQRHSDSVSTCETTKYFNT